MSGWACRGSGAPGILEAFIQQVLVNMPNTEPGEAEMTNKLILPSRTPKPTSAPSGHLCLLGLWNPIQVTSFPRKWSLD